MYDTNYDVVKKLVSLYPKCFILRGEIKPLKIGLFEDLKGACNNQARLPFSIKKLRKALYFYCHSVAYFKACIEGHARVDLAGEAVGVLTKKEAEIAVKKLLAYRAQFKKHRKNIALVKQHQKDNTIDGITETV